MKVEIKLLWNFFTKDLSLIWTDLITQSVGFQNNNANNQIVRDHIQTIRELTYEFLLKYKPGININEEGIHSWNKDINYCSVDLVDGTNTLLLGTPLFGTQFAIVENGIIEEAIIFIPTENKLSNGGLYFAKKNMGAFIIFNGEKTVKLRVSSVNEISKATIAFDGPTKDVATLYSNSLVSNVKRIRNFSAFCWAGTRIARGNNIPVSIDAVIGLNNKPWDHIPYVLLTREAGGKVTNIEGDEDLGDYSNIIFSNGLLHDKILHLLKE